MVSVAHAQEEERVTQEEFACELIQTMKLSGVLPLASLASDCADALERLGISPMAGWNNKAYLGKEDYQVILAKAYGKEARLHEIAQKVEQNNISVINEKWKEVHEELGKWIALEDLLNNKNYFPNGLPKSPYGHAYQDDDGDHKVEAPFNPTVGLMKIRQALSVYDQNLP